MKDIILKIGYKKWIILFGVFLVFTSTFLIYMVNVSSIQFLLFTSFVGSLIITLSFIGIIYFSQRKVLLTNDRIIKVGFSEKLIPYSEIIKIRVGSGGFTVYGNNSYVNISTMQSNFNLAKERIQHIINGNGEIEIVGYKRYIKKYLGKVE